jgi:serine/threonine-protein kinase
MNVPRSEGELPPGTRLLERYTVQDCFDGGGMASIYRAYDERLERVVCVKVLRTTLVEGSGSTSGRAAYRATYTHFLKEALALSKLQHPNTLRIYDFGFYGDPSLPQEERSPFHVSELLSGGNLETMVRTYGRLSEQAACDVVERIAGALAEAHSFGIVHRDIKPSNILFADVGGNKFPKLADFGIARSSTPLGQGNETNVNLTLCSPRWAAPEQLSAGQEGPVTDIYALGLVLHFMLVGRPAFAVPQIRETFSARIVDDDYVTTRVREAGLRPPIEAVLLACLRANPAARFQDVVTFARAVRAAVETPVEATPPRSEARPSSGQPSTVAPMGATALEANVRFVEVVERADLAFTGRAGESRVRISFQPTSSKVNVKSLSGFVRRDGARPSAAVLVEQDARIELVGADGSVRLTIELRFGGKSPEGLVFLVDGHPVLVPSGRASQAVALFVAETREVVIVARR